MRRHAIVFARVDVEQVLPGDRAMFYYACFSRRPSWAGASLRRDGLHRYYVRLMIYFQSL